ncbi:hypothetical protein GKZ68_16645 [Hymenobacter sp. BRD128]|uniref:hypothetical protein n=1 Tax=Hymenobacter sp. BRD128 TaxID=2675878 RepID=UPI00156727D5|nr:hypothetical protein [Hymenobacter sp. BRD128]QKG58108.1 hypothetical protein GKZ68_16645 [Hymenobacter sp. BRD128]
MLRRLLLPLLGAALFASEAASAQTLPAVSAAQPVASAYSHPAARPKALTAREKRAAEAAAKAEAAKAAKAVAAVPPAQPDSTASTSWNGWSNEPAHQATNASYRPATNLSVAPGMPLNQVGHGVTTDYNGHPLHHEVVSTTLSPTR